LVIIVIVIKRSLADAKAHLSELVDQAEHGFAPVQVDRFVDGFLANAAVVTIGPKRARQVQKVAVATRLRAAEATDVWLAETEGIPLVTADQEIHQRATARCQVMGP
jgi:hypothetical protein